jgi:hypothetical protein
MAEGLLGEGLREEDEKSERAASEPQAGAEAFAAAIAAIAARQDPRVARDTSTFLNDQAALLKVHKKHLEEEHAVRLHQLRGQAHEGDIRRVGLRLRVALQIFYAIIATVVGIGFVVMSGDAFNSSSVAKQKR